MKPMDRTAQGCSEPGKEPAQWQLGLDNISKDPSVLRCEKHTCPYLWTNLKILRNRARATARRCRRRLPFIEVCCLAEAG